VVSLTQASAAGVAGRTPVLQRSVMLETNGFVLRSLVPDDINPRVLSWLSAGEMMQGLNLASLNFALGQLREFVGKFDNLRNYFIGIFDKSNGLLIGFYTIDVDLRHRVGQITTGIGEPAYLGKGTLWATIDALLDHFYVERNVDKISARILAKNYRMLFNFKDNPRFVLEGCLREECLAPDGKRVDILLFASYKNGPRPG
jgi:RimJ/RimL family protein N-acetyltransferase